jgi:hypothetical protein
MRRFTEHALLEVVGDELVESRLLG